MSIFGIEDVKQLVECARRALQNEDRYLVNCFKERGWKERPDGIRCNMNERYYQFIVWRELMASFPWRAKTERQSYDLVFYDGETDEPVAFAEIKGWWSPSGVEELRGIKSDIVKKLEVSGRPGVMLILTGHPVGVAEENLAWLANALAVSRTDMLTACFRTTPWPGQNCDTEFAIIGVLVTPAARQASA